MLLDNEPDLCEKEIYVGLKLVFCIRKIGHDGKCIFADPSVIYGDNKDE